LLVGQVQLRSLSLLVSAWISIEVNRMAACFLNGGGTFNAADNKCVAESDFNKEQYSCLSKEKMTSTNTKGFAVTFLTLSLFFLLPSVSFKNASPAAPERSLITGITTHTDLNTAVSAWCSNSTAATSTYGHISEWDISTVTSMKYLFAAQCSTLSTFNEPLEAWDVSSVVDMLDALKGASSFNQPLAMWDVSSVTSLQSFLEKAILFDQNLIAWDTSKVKSFHGLFFETSFNYDISPWNISNVVSMNYMFAGATAFNQVLCWDLTGKVTSGMFGSSSGSASTTAAKCSCEAGEFYESNATACSLCPAGSISYGQADSCIDCTSGSSSFDGTALSPSTYVIYTKKIL